MGQNIDVQFFRPFVDGTIHMLKVQCQLTATHGIPYLKGKTPGQLTVDIAGLVGIWTDKYRGIICVSFPESTYLNIMNKMLDEKFDAISSDNNDGAGEMMNMIFGFAKRVLNEKGHDFQKALPSVIVGKNIHVSHQADTPVFVLPFSSDFGEFQLEIGLTTV